MNHFPYIVSQPRKGGPIILQMMDLRRRLPDYDTVNLEGRKVELIKDGKPVLVAQLDRDGLVIETKTRSVITFIPQQVTAAETVIQQP